MVIFNGREEGIGVEFPRVVQESSKSGLDCIIGSEGAWKAGMVGASR